MDMRHTRGTTLIELLVAISILGLLAMICLPVLGRAYQRARVHALKSAAFQNQRIGAFLRDDIAEADLMWHATNTPRTYVPDHYIVH